MVPQPMNEAMQAGLREACFDVTFLPMDFATAINQMRAGARDPASRAAHVTDVALPSMERNTGGAIYGGQLSNPRGINRGFHNSSAVDAQLRVVRNRFMPAEQARHTGQPRR